MANKPGDATLSKIFFNLIKNAIEAASHESQSPQVKLSTGSERNSVTVSVSDNGPGIPVELRARLFDPFVTGSIEGTGLGLLLVAERVRDIEGTIHCSSDSARGTEFRVQIPTGSER